jgi:hypothetical protein
LRDVDVHQILGGLPEVGELLLQTYANKRRATYIPGSITTKIFKGERLLTFLDLCSPFLKDRHLILGLHELLLEGILRLLGTYTHQRSKSTKDLPESRR